MLHRTGLALAAVVAVLAPALPAQAESSDRGDGRVTCNNGEICFQLVWDDFTTSTYQRHFWWSNMDHSNQLFHNASCGGCGIFLMDNARGVWNRDTQCYIRLWDIAPSGWFYYAQLPRGLRGDFGSQQNNGHSRCR